MNIRPATSADLLGILTIYNEVIATSTAVYALVPVTFDERQSWFEARQALGYPILVAHETNLNGVSEVVGFASFGDWRGAWPGYRYTVEHSVHVRSDRRGNGIGSRLLEPLFQLAMDMDKHVMVGAIDAANRASLHFHERLGFVPVAHFQEVGHKFGRWLDLVFMQRILDIPGAHRI